MSTYLPEQLLSLWAKSKLTVEMAIGHILQRLLDHDQRLRRLIDVGRSLVSQHDLETLLAQVLDVARELTGPRYAALGVLDESRQSLGRFPTRGIDPETPRAFGALPPGRGILGLLIQEPRPLRLHDLRAHPRWCGFPATPPPMLQRTRSSNPAPSCTARWQASVQPASARMTRSSHHSSRRSPRRRGILTRARFNRLRV